MKQIGNLAIVCARRKDVTLRIEQGRVMVLLDGTYAPTAFFTDWDDDDTILSIIHELNFGHCAPKPMKTEEWQEKAAFIDKLRELTDRLNRCRAAYEAHTPLVSDEVYDILFSDLQTLESWLGLRMKNSPTKKGNHLV